MSSISTFSLNPDNEGASLKLETFKTEIIDMIKYESAKIQAKMDRFLDKVDGHQGHTEKIPEEDLYSLFPIQTSKSMTEVEAKLSDNQFFIGLVRKYKEEFSKSAFDWKKVCYLLVDQIFSRALLKYYSWTGISKTHSKSSFSSLKNINRAFFAIVKASDPNYTKANHEEFFKNAILKHSDVRAAIIEKGSKRKSLPRTSLSKKKRSVLSLEDILEDNETVEDNAE